MIFLYRISIAFYVLLLNIASYFNPKAKLWVNGRKNWREKLKNKINNKHDYIWFHAASLGEFEQGRPVIEKIKLQNPNIKVILTFFSPSGYEIRKNYPGADIIVYLPSDSPANAKDFINIVKPVKAYFIKYEFWFFFLRELKTNNIPTYIFSSIFREKQIFFKPYGSFHRRMLSFFTHIFVQDNKSSQLLSSISVNNHTVAGDTRFDRVMEIAQNADKLPIVDAFKNNTQILIAGSTWPKDEQLLSQYINNSHANLKFIIAPHEVHQEHIVDIVKLLKCDYICYTKANIENVKNAKVLIIDCIGLLSSMYQYGNISYIGGGFGVGIHNTLEAATFALPVIFGPNYAKFKEAIDLINTKAAFSFTQQKELNILIDDFVCNEKSLLKASQASALYVKNMCGASSKIMQKS